MDHGQECETLDDMSPVGPGALGSAQSPRPGSAFWTCHLASYHPGLSLLPCEGADTGAYWAP